MTQERFDLAILDFDGTISNRGQIGKAMYKGLEHIQQNGVKSTITTGKGIKQLQNRLGFKMKKIVSSQIPVSVENGGRLVNEENENIYYHPLAQQEIRAIKQIVVTYSDSITAVAYHPKNSDSNMVVWSPNGEDLRRINNKDMNISDIVTLSPKSFFKKVLDDRPCMLVIAAKENDFDEVFPKGLNVVTNESVININAEGISKGTSLIELSELTGIALPNILVAGNDENDLPLMNSQSGIKVWIGDLPHSLTKKSNLLNFNNPDDFGKYFNKLPL